MRSGISPSRLYKGNLTPAELELVQDFKVFMTATAPGPESPILARDLSAALNLSHGASSSSGNGAGSLLRALSFAALRQGICVIGSNRGYYLATSLADVNRAVRTLEARARSEQARASLLADLGARLFRNVSWSGLKKVA